MEFTNEFHVPTDPDTAFALLTDLERVAPCLPGATLEAADGDSYTGKVRVKVGPIQVTYQGTARVVEADPVAHTAVIEASGREQRGGGTARADVRAQLREHDGGTTVTVTTDLNVTGRPAQFGRGVMADVGTKIIGTFAQRLQEMVTADADPSDTTDAASPQADEPGDVATLAPPDAAAGATSRQPDDDALDLMEVAGGAVLKRVLPIVGIAAVIALVWWLIRRR